MQVINRDDAAYYRRRLEEEQQQAASSHHAAIAQIHLQLAAHYEQALACFFSQAASADLPASVSGSQAKRKKR